MLTRSAEVSQHICDPLIVESPSGFRRSQRPVLPAEVDPDRTLADVEFARQVGRGAESIQGASVVADSAIGAASASRARMERVHHRAASLDELEMARDELTDALEDALDASSAGVLDGD